MRNLLGGLVAAAVLLGATSCSDPDTYTLERPTTTVPAPPVSADPAECTRVSDEFSKIATELPTSGGDATATIERMKAVLPEDLQDDLQRMVDAYVAGDSAGAASAMRPITVYVTGVCKTTGG